MPEARPKVLLGVAGSIAAYKAAELLRRCTRKGWDVWPLMTRCATQYIGELTFRSLSGHPVPVGRFEELAPATYVHLDLAAGAAAMVIAPCTANLLAKLAQGLADDVVCATALACRAPLIVAPAMNENMWLHPATQENVARLRGRGVEVLDTERGALGCGVEGQGRLCALAQIVAAIEKHLARQPA